MGRSISKGGNNMITVYAYIMLNLHQSLVSDGDFNIHGAELGEAILGESYEWGKGR